MKMIELIIDPSYSENGGARIGKPSESPGHAEYCPNYKKFIGWPRTEAEQEDVDKGRVPKVKITNIETGESIIFEQQSYRANGYYSAMINDEVYTLIV